MSKDDEERIAKKCASHPAKATHGAPAACKRPSPSAPAAPAQVDKLVAAPTPSRLAYAETLLLGDQIIFTRTDSQIFIMNLGGAPGHVYPKLQGHPSIRMVRSPDRIQPSAQGFDPTSEIALEFNPTSSGWVHAKFSAEFVFDDGSGSEHVEIFIIGGAHGAAEEPLVEKEAREKREADESKDARERDAAKERVIKRIHADEAAGKTHHPGHMRALEREKNAMTGAMFDVIQARHSGVNDANTEIGVFQRKHAAPENPSLLSDMAWLALDVATAGIAGAVGKTVEVSIKLEDKGEKVIAAFFTDSIKESIKQTEKKGKEAVHAPGKPDSWPVSMGDPKAAFIGQQSASIGESGSTHERAARTADYVFDALLPVLDKSPEAAISAMRTATAVLAAQVQATQKEQKKQTELHWIRYVGSTSAAGHELAVAPTEHAPMREFDGVVDVHFKPGNTPEDKVEIKSAHVNGLRNGLVERLGAGLVDAGVTVRAIADHADMDAVTPLTVVREHGGNVTYVDQTRDGRTSYWFARHAGILHGGENAQLAGARQLIEHEILPANIAPLLKGDGES